jgi:hypothetical protein
MRSVIPRRPRVTAWMGAVFAVAFALAVTPSVSADRWLRAMSAGQVVAGQLASITIRVPPFEGHDATAGSPGGAIVIRRGEIATAAEAAAVRAIDADRPHGPAPYLALMALFACLGAVFSHHARRSNAGRLIRVQLVSLGLIALAAGCAEIALSMTAISSLALPVALFAMVPTLVLDRTVGLATGVLAALVFAFLTPFDVGVAIVLLCQASAAGLVIAERPRRPGRAILVAGGVTTVLTALTYPLLMYLTHGRLPLDELGHPSSSAWVAAALGPLIATVAAAALIAPYQLLVGEITRGRLVLLEELSNPLLRQIAEKSPGTWQHSLMMANLAEIAANAIGADGRLVRVGAYYHDLGKSLQPTYFIENLEPGQSSPHDQLPPEVSCDAIFAHVTEGIVAARRAGLHERIIDFMHMHHGNGVLEYFWARCREQGNPRGLAIEQFLYPGHPPQSRETAILAICDAVEAASRTLKKADPQAIDQLVQRIVYGKLHLGQLDESGLSMGDLRRVSDSLRETIRHANHGRIEYPWQRAQEDASATAPLGARAATTGPRLDSLDRPRPGWTEASGPIAMPDAATSDLGLVTTGVVTPPLPRPRTISAEALESTARHAALASEPAAPPAEASAAAAPIPARPSAPQVTATPPLPEAPSALIGIPAVTVDRPSARLLPLPAPSDVLDEHAAPPSPAARRRAATLPPTPTPRRAPTVPPPAMSGGTRQTSPAMAAVRPPTQPPPLTLPAEELLLPVAADAAATPPRDEAGTRPRLIPPSAPPANRASRARLPLPAPPASDPRLALPDAPVDSLAARIDAALEHEEFGGETRAMPPSVADLAASGRAPAGDDGATSGPGQDTTKRQSLAELERLSRGAVRDATVVADPGEVARHQRLSGTHEVDPDDIEAAIELAPPARRTGRVPIALGHAKPKKPASE